MPNINKSGKVLYSLYDNGGYKIAIIDSLQLIDETLVGYSKLTIKRMKTYPILF